LLPLYPSLEDPSLVFMARTFSIVSFTTIWPLLMIATCFSELLSFFEVVRREEDGETFLRELAQIIPHAAAKLDVHTRGRLIENKERGS
jgi:hypothetical protein